MQNLIYIFLAFISIHSYAQPGVKRIQFSAIVEIEADIKNTVIVEISCSRTGIIFAPLAPFPLYTMKDDENEITVFSEYKIFRTGIDYNRTIGQ